MSLLLIDTNSALHARIQDVLPAGQSCLFAGNADQAVAMVADTSVTHVLLPARSIDDVTAVARRLRMARNDLGLIAVTEGAGSTAVDPGRLATVADDCLHLPVDEHFAKRLLFALARRDRRSDEGNLARGFIESVPDAVLMLAAGGQVCDCNTEAVHLFGISRAELCGRHVMDLVIRRGGEQALQLDNAPRDRFFPVTVRHQSAGDIPCDMRLSVLEQPTVGWLVYLRDASSRDRYSVSLHRRERHLGAIAELAEYLLYAQRALDYGRIAAKLAPAVGACRAQIYLIHQGTEADGNGSAEADESGRECIAEWLDEEMRRNLGGPLAQRLHAASERDQILDRWMPLLLSGEVVVAPVSVFREAELSGLQSAGIRSVLVVPVLRGRELFGFMRFDSRTGHPGWEPGDIRFLVAAARDISHTLVRIRERRERERAQSALRKDQAWLQAIREASELVTGSGALDTRLSDVVRLLRRIMPVNRFILTMELPRGVRTHIVGVDTDGKITSRREETGWVCRDQARHRRSVRVCDGDSGQAEMRSCICLPLNDGESCLGSLSLASAEEGAFDASHITHLESLAIQVGHSVAALRRYELARTETERLETIVREVHHRIKNNLQGVIGLLQRHQEARPEAAATLKTAVAQLHAVAAVHDLLSRHTNEIVHLDELVCGVCRMVQPLSRHPIQVDAGQGHWTVPAAEAVPIALVVNELVQNAVDHGYPDGRAGEIQVQLEPLDQGVCLRVANDGVPPPEQSQQPSAGMGLALVRSLMPLQGSGFSLTHESGWTIARAMYTDARVVMVADMHAAR